MNKGIRWDNIGIKNAVKVRREKMIIGIIGAMDEEVAMLKDKMSGAKVEEYAGMTFFSGDLFGKKAIVVRSGIGKVNAAACAQILILKYQATAVINTGIAGSLHNDIDIGDVVVSTDAVQHDVDATEFGYEAGLIPRMDVLAFPTDEKLQELAVEANREANPQIKTFTGRIGTGDQFIANQEVKDEIIRKFSPLCAEMEGAAIAQVAYINKVSCVIIRAISDKADNSATVDYPSFEKQAIANSVSLMENMLTKM